MISRFMVFSSGLRELGARCGLALNNRLLAPVPPLGPSRVGAVGPQDAMAWNGELERVLRAGVADCPDCSWSANRAGDLKEGCRPPERNSPHRLPYPALEIRAPDIQGKRKVSAGVLDETDHRFDHLSCARAVMPQLSAGKARSQSFDKGFIARVLPDNDCDDPSVGGSDQDGGDGRLTQAVPDQLAGPLRRFPRVRLTGAPVFWRH
jgi:hypothetical protein